MCEPEAVGTIVRGIMREMQETIARVGGDPDGIELWDEPPRPAPLPKPLLRLFQGGKAEADPKSTCPPAEEPHHG